MSEITQQNSDKAKNKKLSLALIFLNSVFVILLFGGTFGYDPDHVQSILAFILLLPLLLGIYTFSYKEKEDRWAKWLFWLSLLVALVSLGIYWYLYELAKGFKN